MRMLTSQLAPLHNPALSVAARGDVSVARMADLVADEMEAGRVDKAFDGRGVRWGERDLMLDEELVLVLLSQQMELGYIGVAVEGPPTWSFKVVEVELPHWLDRWLERWTLCMSVATVATVLAGWLVRYV